MAFHNPAGLRERILSFGPSGTGKTHDIFTVAKMSQQTGSPSRFYYADTDDTAERMLATDFADLTNVVHERVFDWEDLTSVGRETTVRRGQGVPGFIERSMAVATKDDWLVVDLLDPTWQWVQDFFTNGVWQQDLGEFFLAARASMVAKKQENPKAKDEGAFEGWKDWPVINGLYKTFMQLFLRWPGHVYCTATAAAINASTDTREIIDVFGEIGHRPNGQKMTAHSFHTCLLKKKTAQGWAMSTAKDRGRELQRGVMVSNFALSYLVAIGGWKP